MYFYPYSMDKGLLPWKIYVFGNTRTVIFRYLLTIFYRREHRPVPPGSSRDCRQYFYWGHHAASFFIVFIFITKMIKAPCFFLLYYLLKFFLIWFMTIRVKFYTEFLLNELFYRVSCLLILFTLFSLNVFDTTS